MLLNHHTMHTYSRAIPSWLEEHPIRVFDTRNVTAIEPLYDDYVRMHLNMLDRRVEQQEMLCCRRRQDNYFKKERQDPSKMQAHTIERYFRPLLTRLPRKRQRQEACRISKINYTSNGGGLKNGPGIRTSN